MDNMKNIITSYGFVSAENDIIKQDVSEYSANFAMLNKVSVRENKKTFWTNKIRWKNEWHDEILTQIQLFVHNDMVGLGSGKYIIKEILSKYLKKEVDLVVKTEYVEDLVPSIEIIVDGTNVASCGFVRFSKMKEYGYEDNGLFITFIEERLNEVNK